MAPSPFQRPFSLLKQTEEEFLVAQDALDAALADPTLVGTARASTAKTRAELERTYLLRLLSEFENGITRAAPHLSITPPLNFTDRDGLAFKLDQIGSKLSINQALRDIVDNDIRAHRNELAHGRSLVARVPFDRSKDLMFEYLRNLR